MDRSELAIVIPAYNEGKTIADVIRGALAYGNVVVVNDCSKDDTASQAESAGAIVVSHFSNKGYDGALNSGFLKAKEIDAKYIITMDADGQHSFSLIKQYINLLESGNELVIGIRPNTARLAEKVFAGVARLCWGIRDPLCGMKGYHITLFEKNGAFDTCNSIGTELAIQSARRKCKMAQIAIPIQNRIDGAPRFGRIVSANKKIFLAMVRILRLPKIGA